jgi:hypothetical protein
MPGGLLQLVAVGEQDQVLTAEPQRTFWQHVYQRHSHFAMESVRQTVTGPVAYGSTVSVTLGRNGDLVTGLTLELVMKRGAGTPFYPAEHVLKYAELLIGGQRIDHLTGTWLRLYDELLRPVDSRSAHEAMTNFCTPAGTTQGGTPVGGVKRFYLSLPFWFCRGDRGAALPLIALQYHDVELRLTFESSVPGVDASFPLDLAVYADFVFLDAPERRQFAQRPHRYLIEQTQFLRDTVSVSASQRARTVVPLSFNHPVKFLAWVFRPVTGGSHGVFTSSGTGLEDEETYAPLHEALLQCNGTDMFETRKGSYFRLAHPAPLFGQAPSAGVYAYSFALVPRSTNPSGSLNLSRIDTAQLLLTMKRATLAAAADARAEDETLAAALAMTAVEVFARSFNVLTVRAGMGGLAWAS